MSATVIQTLLDKTKDFSLDETLVFLAKEGFTIFGERLAAFFAAFFGATFLG